MNNIHAKKLLIRVIWICAALAVWVPLFYAPQTLYPFIFPKIIVFQVLVEVSLIAWALLLLLDRSYASILKHPISLSLFVFIAAALLSSVFGIDPQRSFFSTQERMTGIVLMIHGALWYVVLGSVMKTKKQWIQLLWLSAGASLLVGFFAIDFNVIGDFLFHGKKWQPVSTLGNPIYVGVYALLHIFICLVLSALEHGKIRKYFALFLIIWNLSILYISASRGPIIALLVGIAALAVLFAIRHGSVDFRKKAVITLFGVIGTIGLLLVAVNVFHIKLPYTLERIALQGESGFTERLKLWKFGVDAFRERPVLGWGWENFNVFYNRHYKEPGYGVDLTDIWVDRTHNQVIDILVNGGVVGLLAYTCFWLVLLYFLFRSLASQTIKPEYKFSVAIVISAFIAYFVQNISVFDTPAPLILFYLLLGFAYFILSQTTTVSNTKPPSLQQKQSSLYVVLVMGFCGIMVYQIIALNIVPFTESMGVVKGIRMFKTMPTDALKAFEDALAHPSYISYEGRLQLSSTVVNAIQQLSISPEEKRRILDFAIREMKKNINEHPSDIKGYYAYSMLSRIAYSYGFGTLNEAEALMKKAFELAPYRSETLREMFEIYSMLGNVKEASVWAQKFGKSFGEGESHYLLGMMHLRSNNYANALTEFIKGDKQGYNAFQDSSIIIYIVKNIPAKEITKDYIAFVDRGAEYYPQNSDFLGSRIVIHYKAGDRAMAQKYLDEVYAQNAEFATAIENYLKTLK